MAAETLGAIALLDPTIKLVFKVRKIHKHQISFGKDFIDSVCIFNAEQVCLYELLSTPIELLSDGQTKSELREVLGDGTPQGLKDLLNQKPNDFAARVLLVSLAKLSVDFEECHKIVDNYLPDEPLQRDRTPQNMSVVEGSRSSIGNPNSTASFAINQLSSPESRDTPDTKDTSIAVYTIQEPRDSRKKPSIRSLVRKFLHMQPKDSLPASSSAGTNNKDTSARMPAYLQSPILQETRVLQQSLRQGMQDSVGLRRRLFDWKDDAEDLTSHIRSIQTESRFLERYLHLVDVKQDRQQRHQVPPPSTVEEGRSLSDGSGPFLNVLAQVLDESNRPSETTLALELLASYESYTADVNRDASNQYLDLKDSEILFPVKVSFAPNSDREQLASAVLVAVKGPLQDHQQSPVRRWNVTSSSANELLAGKFYHSQESFFSHNHSIRILQHFPATATSIKSFTETLGLQINKDIVEFRCYLAHTLAVFHFRTWNTRLNFTQHLKNVQYFFSNPPETTDPEELAVQLMYPYLGWPGNGLSDSGLTGSLHETQPFARHVAVQKLGILFHEIGAWSPIVKAGEERPLLNQAIERAKVKAAESRSIMGLSYYNVVQDCLDWQPEYGEDEFQSKVLVPLFKLKEKHPRPTTERY